jgi:hypothetical protein
MISESAVTVLVKALWEWIQKMFALIGNRGVKIFYLDNKGIMKQRVIIVAMEFV